jgi:Trypsin-co-occurring domain 2
MKVSSDGVPVDELVDAVKNAIVTASLSSADTGRDLRVASIQLTLRVVATVSAGGGLEFRVPFLGMNLKVGGSVTRLDTHTIDITLVPPDLRTRHEIREQPIDTVLVQAIETIRRVVASAAGGDDPFVFKSGTVDLCFAVTEDGSITLGVNGELKKEVAQTLRISLQDPGAQSSPAQGGRQLAG